MSLTKADIIDSIYKNSNLKKEESRFAVDTLLEIIKQTWNQEKTF